MSTTTSRTNEATIRDLNAAVFEDHNLDAIDPFLSRNVVQYENGTEVASGIDEQREYFEGMLAAFPDVELDVLDVVADDDTVMFRFEATGTHSGDLRFTSEDGVTVVAPTNTKLDWQGVVAAQFADGVIAEINLVSDELGMADQLGLVDLEASN